MKQIMQVSCFEDIGQWKIPTKMLLRISCFLASARRYLKTEHEMEPAVLLVLEG